MRREVLYSIACDGCSGHGDYAHSSRVALICQHCFGTGLSMRAIEANLSAQVEPQGITQAQHDLDRPRRVRWIEIKRPDSAR